ncbi:MAG: type II toxin-antitoxin system VapC family toxin [Theionarchaea archaeon]|nr:type II toxin-antitoxin system VapC family toxin [Theionarchaea archaeon]
MNLVLDSSVIAKLFIDEKDSDKATELLEKSSTKDIKLIASTLVFYEVGNTILKHLREKDKDGTEYMDQLFFLNIEYSSLDKALAGEAIRTARINDITYYDAVHITLSQRHKSAFVTEDKELLRKFKNAIPMKDALERIEKEPKTTNLRSL